MTELISNIGARSEFVATRQLQSANVGIRAQKDQ
jgi:hypothetical protein